MEPEDLDFLYGVENDDRLWNVGVTNVPYSKSMLLDYITSATGDIFADKQVRLMIDNEVGETIGMVDLMDRLGIIPERIDIGGGLFGKIADSLKAQFTNEIPCYMDYANQW